MDYGKIIKERRIAKGISLRQFSAACGITPTTLSAVETGKYPPSRETMVKIAKKLDTAPVVLMLDAITQEDIPEANRDELKIMVKKLKALSVQPAVTRRRAVTVKPVARKQKAARVFTIKSAKTMK